MPSMSSDRLRRRIGCSFKKPFERHRARKSALTRAIGAPNSICITPGSTQVLFVGESTYPLDGTVLGVTGRASRNIVTVRLTASSLST